MKRITCILLVLALAISLTACGALSNRTTDDGQSTGNSQQAVESTSNSQQVVDKVTPVINSINEIGSVSLESKDKISEARKLFDDLSESDKIKVTNYSILQAAETQYDALVKAEKDKIINTYKSKFEIEYDKIENITWYMPKNMPEYIDERCYLIPYIGVRNNRAWICVRYNYTEDDWIFWESLSILVDGNKTTKSVGSFNTTRDNDGGVVWEYYDEILNINASIDSNDIQLLEKIANSNETIVRFQGDDYHYDLTVSNKDKSMIKDVLAMYSAFVKD